VRYSLLLLVVVLVGFSSKILAADAWCGDYVDRVQIENGYYLVWLKTGSTSNAFKLGMVGDAQADARFAIAMSSIATGLKTVIKYTNVPTTSCSALTWNSNNIAYFTQMRE
jgi:hypothetical protein